MVRTGFYFAAPVAVLSAGSFWLEWMSASLLLAGLAAFILFFFRDPKRTIPDIPGAIVSPADGRVLSIDEAEWQGKSFMRISIFLSIFNVHVNRAPIAGRITNAEYRHGSFHVASRNVASSENEQNEITMEGEGTTVVFRQIAGLIARRIEFWSKVGDEMSRGERVGMIRFGSRTEILFDPAYRTKVRPGDTVYGGSTVLAVRP